MKKIFALLLSVAMVASMFAGVAFAAPTVTLFPANSAVDQPVTIVPAVIFSEGVLNEDGTEITNPAALITFKETDQNGANVPFTATINDAKTIITITPASPLKNDQDYYLAVANTVTNLGRATVTGDFATWTTVGVNSPVASPVAGAIAMGSTVALSTTTSGATIRYTIGDGTQADPTATTGTVYAGPITISEPSTIKAIAVRGDAVSTVLTAAYTKGTVANPVIAAISSTNTVEITTTTTGATIRYTLDGTNPTATTGTIYTGPVAIDGTKTVNAIAYMAGMNDSAVTTQSRQAVVAAPVITYNATTKLITITTSTPGAAIEWTTNANFDDHPAQNFTYSTPFTLPAGTYTVRARATKAGWANSTVATQAVTVAAAATPQVGAPVATPVAGAVAAGTQVVLTAESGAVIFYTVNGSDPTIGAPGTLVYSAPITINSATTIKAMAYKANMTDSTVATFDYTIAVPQVSLHLTTNVSGTVGLDNTVLITGALKEVGRISLSANRWVQLQRRPIGGTAWSDVMDRVQLNNAGSGDFAFAYKFTQAGDYRLAVMAASTGAAVVEQPAGVPMVYNVGTISASAMSVTVGTTTSAWNNANQVVVPITIVKPHAGGTQQNLYTADVDIYVKYRGSASNVSFTPADDTVNKVVNLTITNLVTTEMSGTIEILVVDKAGNFSGTAVVNMTPRQAFNAFVSYTGSMVVGNSVEFTPTNYDANGRPAGFDNGSVKSAYKYVVVEYSGSAIASTFNVTSGVGTVAPSVAARARRITAAGNIIVKTTAYNWDDVKMAESITEFQVGGGMVRNLTSARVGSTVVLSVTVTDKNGNPINNARVTYTATSGTPFVVRNPVTGLFPATPKIADGQNTVVINGMASQQPAGFAVNNGVYTAEVAIVNNVDNLIDIKVELPKLDLATNTIVWEDYVTWVEGFAINHKLEYTLTVNKDTFVTNNPETVSVVVRDKDGNVVTTGLEFAVADPAANGFTGFNNNFVLVGSTWQNTFNVSGACTLRIRAINTSDRTIAGEINVSVVAPKIEITPSKEKLTADFREIVTVKVFDPRTDEPLVHPITIANGVVRKPDRDWVDTGAFAAIQVRVAPGSTDWVLHGGNTLSGKSEYEFRIVAHSLETKVGGVEQDATIRIRAGATPITVATLALAPATVEVTPKELTLNKNNTMNIRVLNAHGAELKGKTVTLSGMGVSGTYTIPSTGTLSIIAKPTQTGILTGNVVVAVTPDRAGADAIELKVPVVSAPADVVAPTIEVNVPAVTTEATAVITVVVKDDVAVTGIIFGDATVAMFPAKSHMFVRTVSLKEGVNTFVILATDEAGNVASKTVEIERKAPPAPPAPVKHVITIGKANPAIGLDVPANVRNGRLMVPFRWFGEQILGASVDYKVVGSAEIVTLVKGSTTVELTLNSTIAKVNGAPVSLDVAAYATGGRTLVPARFVAETFGYTVDWNAITDDVTFTKK